MKNIKSLAYLYFALCVLLIAAIVILLVVADSSSLPQDWRDPTVGTLLDMLKIVIGAAVGSISAAVAMVIEVEKRSEK